MVYTPSARPPTTALPLLAGATGDLGGRIAHAFARRNVAYRALVRPAASPAARAALEAAGASLVEADFDDPAALRRACAETSCVVSALNGLAPVMLGMQGRLLDAAVEAGVPRFVPSDYSLDYTKTRAGDNRNMDVRRAFMQRVDAAPIAVSSVLNGAFAELLTGEAPIVLREQRVILHWGRADQRFDFTTKDDVAAFTAEVALDASAPRFLRIAGSSVSPRDLAGIMHDLTGSRFRLVRPPGGTALLGVIIRATRAFTRANDDVFPPWQGMQYLRDMATGRGKLAEPLDNARYGERAWTTARDVLARGA